MENNQNTAIAVALVDAIFGKAGVTPANGVNAIEIRTAEAEKIKYAVKMAIVGTTASPYEFYKKRITDNKLHDTNKCHLTVDKLNGVLVLVIDEKNNDDGTKITGSVQPNKYLTGLHINDEEMFGADELAKLLKVNKTWFTDPKQCGDMVHNLQHFEAEWTTRVSKVDNLKGNTLSKLEHTLKSEVPLGFSLTIEPFKGFERKTFKVEINVQYNGDEIEFYLESIDLMQLQLELKVAEVEKQVALFNDEICIFEI